MQLLRWFLHFRNIAFQYDEVFNLMVHESFATYQSNQISSDKNIIQLLLMLCDKCRADKKLR